MFLGFVTPEICRCAGLCLEVGFEQFITRNIPVGNFAAVFRPLTKSVTAQSAEVTSESIGLLES